MKASSLIAAVEDVLQQGRSLLDRLSGELYARPLDGQPAACSLGAHYRHVLDHFLCLVEGTRSGQINYDQRRRNPELESSLAYARLVTEALIDEFHGLSPQGLETDCTVTCSVGYGIGDATAVGSNLAREVMFCVGHAIHHYAILKLLCTGMGVELPHEFGIAPSTLKHLEAQIAQEV